MAKRHMKRCSTSLVIRETGIKTTVRYHLTSVMIAITRKTQVNQNWWECGEKWTITHYWWYNHYQNRSVVPHKIKNRTTIWSNNATSRYIAKGNETSDWKRYLPPCDCCSTIHNSQDMKPPKRPPTDEWIKCGISTQWNVNSVIKKEILPSATTWMNLEGIMLGEII